MKDFREVKVWQRAHQLVLAVHRATSAFPSEERFGLMSQMRRCSVSIPANVAEGCGRFGDKDLARFLRIAMGSASELEYHVLLARDLDLLATATHDELAEKVVEVKRMLASFIRKLRADR